MKYFRVDFYLIIINYALFFLLELILVYLTLFQLNIYLRDSITDDDDVVVVVVTLDDFGLSGCGFSLRDFSNDSIFLI